MTIYKNKKPSVTKAKLAHGIKRWCKNNNEKYIHIKKKQPMQNVNQLLIHNNDIYINETEEYIKNNIGMEEALYYAQYYIYKDDESNMVKYYKIASDKGSLFATKRLGIFYEEKNDYANMKIYYRLLMDSGDAWVPVRLGKYYENATDINENIHKMISCYELGMNRNNIDAFVELGLYYFYQNSYTNMMECFMGGLRISPSHPQLLFCIGFYYSHINHKSLAIKYFKLAAENKHESAIRHLGLYYMECKEYDTALKYLMEGDDDKNSKTVVYISQCKFLMGDYEGAKKYYKLAYDNAQLPLSYKKILGTYVNLYLDMDFNMELAFHCKDILNSKNKEKLDLVISSHIQIMESDTLYQNISI